MKKSTSRTTSFPVLAGAPAPFSELYPQVKALRLTVEARSLGFEQGHVYRFSLETFPGEVVRGCVNRKCCDGGVRIGSFLADAIRSRKTTHQQDGDCIGHERMLRSKRRCGWPFLLSVEIEYHA